ncbi:MAG: asparagine synthase-related protein, partial [Candidatus Micrarchaeia archaeon]
MCGISAIYGNDLKDGESMVRESLAKVTHRGYSLYETASLGKCALGANRLEIVDASNGRQPQANEDGSVYAVFNGEIYNHASLRDDLSGKGHRFRTGTDTEVLVHLWEEYGAGMAERIDSEMFAFFIYDRKKDSFCAARDPYGVKPLCYAVDGSGNHHFASEIKQLAQFGQIEEIKQFPPGHLMVDGVLKRYHTIPQADGAGYGGSAGIILRLRALFDEAVKKRADTDLPLGVFFSGGLDSASVLATALKYNKDVTAITIGKPGSPDILMAERYCDEFGIDMVSADPPDAERLSEMLPEIVRITESFEPVVVRQAAVSYFMAELAKKNGFRVVLCGEGSDELFAGYDVFRQAGGERGVSLWIPEFIAGLPRTQFQRVDRTSMFHTIETRLPFFDTDFADYAIGIPAGLKLKQEDGRKTHKWILRRAMEDRLPDYIIGREKLALSQGAGYH